MSLRLLAPLAGALLLAAGPARAQTAPDSARLVAKLAVGRLFSHAYEAEAEYRLARRFSLSLAPRVVAGRVPEATSPLANAAGDRVTGYGLGLGARFYIPNTGIHETSLEGVYLGLKTEYQFLRLRYQREAWGEDLAADGLLYYNFRSRDFTEAIHRYGGAATLGYQCPILHPRLRLDASASLSALQSRAGATSRYRSSSDDYGYSGTFVTLGLSLGFVVK